MVGLVAQLRLGLAGVDSSALTAESFPWWWAALGYVSQQRVSLEASVDDVAFRSGSRSNGSGATDRLARVPDYLGVTLVRWKGE